MRRVYWLGSVAVPWLLAACGGRVAHPVAVERPVDDLLTCAHLDGEASVNRKRIVELTGEKGDKAGYNVGMLLVSPFFLDLKQSEKQEIEALVKRNQRLEDLRAEKNCLPAAAQ